MNKTLGKNGERIAAQYLQRKGYQIITSNFYKREGEIDIIVWDNATLVFVEVKTRRNLKYGRPEESITPAKQQKLIRASHYYLYQKKLFGINWRLDVITLLIKPGGKSLTLKHFKNAIEAR